MNRARIWYFNVGTKWYRDEKIRMMLERRDGFALVTIWFMFLALAGETNKRGEIWLGTRAPYSLDDLAAVLVLQVDLLVHAIDTFLELKLITVQEYQRPMRDGFKKMYVVDVVNWANWQNLDALEKLRKRERDAENSRRYRQRKRSERELEQGDSSQSKLLMPPKKEASKCRVENEEVADESADGSLTECVESSDVKSDGNADATSQGTQVVSFTNEEKNDENADAFQEELRVQSREVHTWGTYSTKKNSKTVCTSSLSVPKEGERSSINLNFSSSEKHAQEQLNRLLNPIEQQTIVSLLGINYHPTMICKKFGVDGEAVRLVAQVYADRIATERFVREKPWLAKLFNRPSGSPWSEQEEALAKKLLPIAEEDRRLLRWAYSRPVNSDGWPTDTDGYRRYNTKPKQSLLALLKEFQSECDKWRRARADSDLPEDVDEDELSE